MLQICHIVALSAAARHLRLHLAINPDTIVIKVSE